MTKKCYRNLILFGFYILIFGNYQVYSQSGSNNSRFGLDYVFPTDPQYQNKPFAKIYSQAGLKWVNFADVKWQYIESRKPVGSKHFYNWDKLDKAVKHWQTYGFDITMTLRLGKSWFSGPKKVNVEVPPNLKPMAAFSDRLPKTAHLQDYKDWLSALVERYDGDGTKDMPGLKRPILYYQIGNEYGNPVFFTGTIDDYFKLLKMACESIRAACSNAKIIPNGLRTNDLFHNDPEADNIQASLDKFFLGLDELYKIGWTRSMDLDEQIIEKKGYYDILDAGGNGSWHTTSEGYYKYIKRIQKKHNNEIPIWDMESRNEPLLTPIETTHLHMELGIPRGQHILNLLKWKNNREHHKAVKWYRQEQARITAKVFVTRFATGFEKVFMGMPMDWDKGIGAISWPNPFMGFVDSETQKWSAYYTLKFLIRKLDGYVKAEKIGLEQDLSLYKFSFANQKDCYVVWIEDKKTRGLNDALLSKKVTLKGINANAVLEIPMSDTGAKKVNFQNTDEGCEFAASSTPIFIHPK